MKLRVYNYPEYISDEKFLWLYIRKILFHLRVSLDFPRRNALDVFLGRADFKIHASDRSVEARIFTS